ncbi:MAG: DUF1659 domain-containing protein [Acidaminococcaceae bacterium]
MATKTVEKVSLQVQVDNGLSSTGIAVSKNYTYNNVKPAAAADQVLAVGKALSGLIDHELRGIYCTERSVLTEA